MVWDESERMGIGKGMKVAGVVRAVCAAGWGGSCMSLCVAQKQERNRGIWFSQKKKKKKPFVNTGFMFM